jgi:GT2 family glycosyltransferase
MKGEGPPVVPPDAARVAVVIVSWNSREDLVPCLRSLAAVTLPLEVVVVDNASADGSAAVARGLLPAGRVIEAGANLGFGRASNLGWRATGAPQVLFLNPDAEVRPGALEAMSARLEARPEVGIVGPLTKTPDETPQLSFGPDLTLLAEWRQRRLVRGVEARDPRVLERVGSLVAREHEPAWVSASCLLARRSLLERLHGFDEQFFLYEEDVDLCLRARQAGSRVLFTPAAQVVHRRGRSMDRALGRARREYDRSHLLYYRKHHGGWRTGLLYLSLLVRGRAGVRS